MTDLREQAVCDYFNKANPVGTKVLYWKGVHEGKPSGVAATRSEAQVLGGHTAVVWVHGEPACIALTHVEVAPSYVRATNAGPCQGRATTVYLVRVDECTATQSACRACAGWAEKWALIDKSCCCLRGGWAACSRLAPGASGRPTDGAKVVTVEVADVGPWRMVQGATSERWDDPTGVPALMVLAQACTPIGG